RTRSSISAASASCFLRTTSSIALPTRQSRAALEVHTRLGGRANASTSASLASTSSQSHAGPRDVHLLGDERLERRDHAGSNRKFVPCAERNTWTSASSGAATISAGGSGSRAR